MLTRSADAVEEAGSRKTRGRIGISRLAESKPVRFHAFPAGEVDVAGQSLGPGGIAREQCLLAEVGARAVFEREHVGRLERPVRDARVREIAARKRGRLEPRIGRICPWRAEQLIADRPRKVVRFIGNVRFVERTHRKARQRIVGVGVRWNLHDADRVLGVICRDDARTVHRIGVEVRRAGAPLAAGKTIVGVDRNAGVPCGLIDPVRAVFRARRIIELGAWIIRRVLPREIEGTDVTVIGQRLRRGRRRRAGLGNGALLVALRRLSRGYSCARDERRKSEGCSLHTRLVYAARPARQYPKNASPAVLG